MSGFPETDLPDYFPTDIELPMQNRKLFDELHAAAERYNYFFSAAHSVIKHVAEPALDNPPLIGAVITGIEAYEITSTAVGPTGLYDDEFEKKVVFTCISRFLGNSRSPGYFARGADYAYQRLITDAPRFAELVEQVSYRHVGHDKVATTFALKGAAMIRGVHILVSRQLAEDN